MKILFTIGRLNIGGAEMRLLALCEEISKSYELHFYIVSGLPGHLDKKFQQAGVNLHYGRSGHLGLIDLYKVCQRTRPDILHINAQSAAGFYAFIGWLCRIKVRIAHYRTTKPMSLSLTQKMKYAFYDIVTNTFCTQFFGVSDACKLGYWVWRPWKTIYNGIRATTQTDSLSRLNEFDSQQKHILVLGRLQKSKNLKRSIEIFSTLIKQLPDCHLHIVGPDVDNQMRDLILQTENLNLTDKVFFHGPTEHSVRFLASATVVLTTSEREGLPGVVLESLACGTPVVSSDVPGAIEIARKTSGLKCLALSEPDIVWANELINSMKISRSSIANSFSTSVFSHASHVTQMKETWGALIAKAQ